MKKTITKEAICVKNIITWSVISCACIIALFTFARQFRQDMSDGQELFIPGIIALIGGVLLLLTFGVTRVMKYIRLYSIK